jgi:hypothetical protein
VVSSDVTDESVPVSTALAPSEAVGIERPKSPWGSYEVMNQSGLRLLKMLLRSLLRLSPIFLQQTVFTSQFPRRQKLRRIESLQASPRYVSIVLHLVSAKFRNS